MSGVPGSRHINAPPARRTASMDTGAHDDFSNKSGTIVSATTPRAASSSASLPEYDQSSAYVNEASHPSIAWDWGCVLT